MLDLNGGANHIGHTIESVSFSLFYIDAVEIMSVLSFVCRFVALFVDLFNFLGNTAQVRLEVSEDAVTCCFEGRLNCA